MQRPDWQSVVTEHGPLVWQTAYRLVGNHADAADCFQETFLAAFELANRQPVRNMPALLTRLTTSRAIDRLRQRCRRNRRQIEAEQWRAESSDTGDPLSHIQNLELAEQLTASLSQLPEREANAFCLRYLSDMSYREIARQLNVKVATAGVLLHRARNRLKEIMTSEPIEENEVLS